jgi:arylsulfatase A-like enzyme
MAPGPNLLFVTLDQLRADVIFGALHGIVPTPALDRLRAEGTAFRQCFTAAVPCGPARASLLTGLYAFTHRGIRNGTPVAAHHATLGTELRRAGMEPLLFGYCDMAADPSEHAPGDPDLATYELPARGFREMVEMRFEAPLEWIGHLRAKGYDLPAPQPARWFELYRPAGEGRRAPAFYRAEDSDTAFLTDRTLEALEARRDGAWCAHLTYIRPHPPLVAPEPWNRLAEAQAIPAPTPPGADHPFRRAWFSAPAQHGLFWGFDGRCERLSPQAVTDLRAVYLGLVAEVDHHLGRLLDWLDRTDQAARTLVVLLSDHGEMLGDQGYWGKDNVLAPAHHVPLVIRGPGVVAGHEVDEVISTVDVAPTILDLMGGEVPHAMDGTSLRPFLEGARPERWRGLALTEIDLAEPGAPTRFERALGLDPLTANAAILRDARHSLVHFNGGLAPMLFDRRADPGETTDMAGTPEGAREVARLRAALLDLRMTRADRRLTHLSHLA